MKVLTVCLGNICRSPLAEVLVRKALQEAGIEATVDSAGTGEWHLGELPDARARKVAADHGITLTHTARRLSEQDFSDFDHILVMDEQNLRTVKKLQPTTSKARVKMIRDFNSGILKQLLKVLTMLRNMARLKPSQVQPF